MHVIHIGTVSRYIIRRFMVLHVLFNELYLISDEASYVGMYSLTLNLSSIAREVLISYFCFIKLIIKSS